MQPSPTPCYTFAVQRVLAQDGIHLDDEQAERLVRAFLNLADAGALVSPADDPSRKLKRRKRDSRRGGNRG